MNGAEVAEAYLRIGMDYARVSELLASAEPDLDAVAKVLAEIDGDLAAIPASSDITSLDRAFALQLAASARTCDSHRQQALNDLLNAQVRLTSGAAGDERATRAAQAYRPAEGPSDGRFIDHTR